MNKNNLIIKEMKKRIKKHPVLKLYLNKGIIEYGLSEEEALDCMIETWFNFKKEQGYFDDEELEYFDDCGDVE